jgi:uncharacterized membrane protein YdjX (TVP38/TMEM64 family)
VKQIFSNKVNEGDVISKIKNKKKIIEASKKILLFIIILSAIGIILAFIFLKLGSPEKIAEKIQTFGVLGPVILIILIMLEVIVAPIPGAIISVTSGYAFGAVWGSVYSYIGNILGTAIAFMISRKFGRPLVEKIIGNEKLNYYDSFFRERGVLLLWLIFLFPIFPSDIISFVTGLSQLRFRKFLMIIIIAFVPNLILLNYFGSMLYIHGFGEITLIYGSFLFFLLIIGIMIYMHIKKKHDSSI